jgi:glutaminyl-tRNA synthetase
MSDTTDSNAAETGRNFLQQIIDADLASGRHQSVVTRFPPEPNGYLHIGHAKSIGVNFGLAAEFGGRCHLRFDDTNPLKEDIEFVDSIQADIRWLGYDWKEHLYFASDYFERLYELAEDLIRKGLAYVCSLTVDEMRAFRGTVTEAGRPSPYRDRSVKESLDLFRRMRAGEFPDGAHSLRAKIDMANPNMQMRDPPLYRIRHIHHDRTGDTWCIYPMYDYTHCLSDAFEGITHSICTLEFENNRELYDWIVEATGVESVPRQYEMARMNVTHVMTSKRKLKLLVDEGHVFGWDDPRMPTVAAYRRLGCTAQALRAFIESAGVKKAANVIDDAQLRYFLRDDLNHRSPRVMSVLRPLKVIIENLPEGAREEIDAPYWPHDVPNEGSRRIDFARELYIERDDFMEKPPSKFFRLSPGKEVRLRYAYVIRCVKVIKDAHGEVVELRCTYDPETLGKNPTDRKVKGTIHWVSAAHARRIEVRLYDHLFRSDTPNVSVEGEDFRDDINPNSLVVIDNALVEPSVFDDAFEEKRYQFERNGYFFMDPDSTEERPVFNRTVPLKDSWQKSTAPRAQQFEPTPTRTAERTQSEPNVPLKKEFVPATASLATAFRRMTDDLGIPVDDAETLCSSEDLQRFFESAVAAHNNPKLVANWTINEVLRELKERTLEELKLGPTELGSLVALIDAGTISSKIAKEVFETIVKDGGDPLAIVREKGLEQITDAGAVASILADVIDEHPGQAEACRAGKTKLLGFFVGQVMKKSRGRANPALVQQVVRDALTEASS